MKSDHTTHDLPLDEVVLKVQQMFPNCQKYKECCFETRINKMKQMEMEHRGPSNFEYVKIFWFKNYPAPEGFEGW